MVLLAQVYGQHTNKQHVEELVAAPPTPPGQPVLETYRRVEPAKDP